MPTLHVPVKRLSSTCDTGLHAEILTHVASSLCKLLLVAKFMPLSSSLLQELGTQDQHAWTPISLAFGVIRRGMACRAPVTLFL